ncbi:FAD:protein FMN transferase [Fictibacillus sp. B-59209]|uniref:FAD:protein FMN transferase n=1 Tax=Fictibacillus sp. B-59209 TaxID=3024873 RepID=UPI002E2483BF|nr:FAD:protein FMN transferase [Fictibacillus sp. B-59209]
MKFNAMNCTIQLDGMDMETKMLVKNEMLDFEQAASRFLPNNALEVINNAPLNVPVFLQSQVAELLERSLRLARKTGYYVHPFGGDSMKASGYAQSFEKGEKSSEKEMVSFVTENQFKEPIDQLTKNCIIKTQPFSFDFGGFGKGFIVDRMKELFFVDEKESWLINAGGDLLVTGTREAGIEHPIQMGRDMIRLQLTNCALATSGKNVRKWSMGCREYNHILNGRTGRLANNGVLQASVIAKNVMEAETAAKIFCILPYEEAKTLLYRNFPCIAYFVYFEDHRIAVGGDSTLYEKLEVAQ